MKIALKINERNYGMVDVKESISGTELCREFGAPPPVTLMKLNGKFTPLPEKLKEDDEVELIMTSSSG